MSNDTPQKPPAPKQPSRPEAIRIKHLRFKLPIDLPGGGMENAVRGSSPDDMQTNKTRYEVTLEPWLRRFRIAWFQSGQDVAKTTICVPEVDARSYEEW